jgi:tripartite-type tricarboxylate transporter receptor subunit TctC
MLQECAVRTRQERSTGRLAAALAMACAVAASVLAPPAARAADAYPSKPVKVVVPYAVGGGTDVLTRALAQRMGEIAGQQFVVENRGGADASIGPAVVAKAPADGYTLLAVSGVPFLLNQSAFKELPYHTMRDFVPVAMFASLPMLMVSSKELAVADAKALVAHAKANPGRLTYAGTDQMTYLGMEMIAKGTGTKLVYVPYKGAGPALNDLLGNHVSVMLASPSSAIPHVREGRIKALAVTGHARSPALPDVPTVGETVLPGYELTAWFGVFAPAGTPPGVVERLAADIRKSLDLPALQKQFESLGTDVRFMGPAEYAAFLTKESARWTQAFKDSGLEPK